MPFRAFQAFQLHKKPELTLGSLGIFFTGTTEGKEKQQGASPPTTNLRLGTSSVVEGKQNTFVLSTISQNPQE